MKSTYEFGIYLTHFCNVDLFRQGLYFFRIGLYSKTNENDKEVNDNPKNKDNKEEKTESKHYALPYRTMMGKQHERDFLIRSSDRASSTGHIDDVTSSYCCSVFRVQFQEQKVRLNEGCLFRLDLPYDERRSRIFIEIELVFCELHASDYKNKGLPSLDEYTIVDKTTLCSEDCYGGIHSIYPVTFSTSHFCVVNIQLHGELINFKFIAAPPHYKLIAKYTQNNKNKNKNNNNAHKNGEETNNNNNKGASFAEQLFDERVDCILSENDWNVVNSQHLFYVYCLLNSYEKVRKLIDEYIEKYLSDSAICNLQNEFDALYPIKDCEINVKCEDEESLNNLASIAPLINCSRNVLDNNEVLGDLRSKYTIIGIKDRISDAHRIEITGREICHLIGEDIHLIAGELFRLWHFFLSAIPFCSRSLSVSLMEKWETQFVERWGAAIFRETLTIRARLRVVSTSLSEHEMISRKVRQQSTLSQLESPQLQDVIYMISAAQQAVIFEQTYNLKEQTSLNIDDKQQTHKCCGKHVFVLVHGYQGNSWDMRMFRNHLLVKCDRDLFLMSEANESEGATEGDITEMGLRLAAEIIEFIDANVVSQSHKLCRLSFITHSLGGIIARQAISCSLFRSAAHLIAACYTFISLAVCHCGYLFGRSRALQAGFYLMRSWKKSLCLQQLSLTDHENPRKTFLYKLSKKKSLAYFTNVLLVSSPEDRYTPYHSTRIEMHRKTVQDTKWGRIYNEMVRNLLRPLDNVNLTRFDVSFANKQLNKNGADNKQKLNNLDSIIGRSAHICFLEQPLYIDMLIHVYKKYFISK